MSDENWTHGREESATGDGLALTADALPETYPSRRYRGQIDERITIPARAASHVSATEVLPPDLASRLGIDLWSHQAEALNALGDGENVCVATSTSSGKTYVYALQIARRYLEDPETRALIVYPTKALSRDQERELNDLLRGTLDLDVTVGVYDGDTRHDDKRRIREEANVVITNFAGLNQYLEGHHRWATFHANCDLIVVDEAHSWTGLGGMHAAWILRRTRRIVDWYGGDPQYVLTSATIGNPADHARALTGEPATVVDEDGSPRGERDLVFWDPPTKNGDGNGTTGGTGDSAAGETAAPSDGWETPSKRPATVEAPEVWAHLCYHDVPSLLFCGSRKGTELAVDRAESFLGDSGLPYQGTAALEPYNAGHGKQSRRATENRLKDGRLDGVATTSALEVGIDVGGVDGTVLQGYPGSRQSFWQRIGRSGRGERDALSVFVPSHATLDRYLLEHPEYVLETDHENAVVDLENNPVYRRHVNCAAQELPLTTADADRFGGRDRLERAVEFGRRLGDLEGALAGGVTTAHRDRPQDEVSLYATGGNTFEVRLVGEGSIDHEPIGRDRAYRDYHEGAIVRFRGEQYEVVALREDRPQPVVELERVDVDYYTQSQGQVRIYDTEVRESRDVGPFRLNYGYGTVTIHYSTFMRREVGSGDVRAVGLETGVPPLSMRTQLCWAEVPEDVDRAVRTAHSAYHNDECEAIPPRLHGYLGGIHAIEHAMIAVAPLELNVDAADLGGLATNRLPDASDTSGWFIYDAIEGGVGFARSIYDEYEAVARRARELMVDCPCGRDEGCPACLMSDRCGNDNRPLYAPAATDVIDALLDDRDPEADEFGDDETGTDQRRPPASIS
ncbi:DEAD/DEAH box helicase [Halosolutus amylolyticus]|uniref:DEAD/DEAH box helicase n=1 Tax=Halosolutus amylolyticus TaxID=2932267 RepID=A0ABD5PNB1_9EURY|nr:DEAD/DEAH box helicase [Halosolutus amylolyticus]